MLLSSLAVVLGVAFIAGTMIFIDGMRAGAYERAGTFDRHTDLGVYRPAVSCCPRPWSMRCARSTGWPPQQVS